MKKIFILSIILFSIYLLYPQNAFRLHVIPNSNATEDLIIKLKVSNEIEKYITTLTKDSKTKKESYNIISQNIDEITKCANTFLSKNNIDYFAYVDIGNKEYNSKQSHTIYQNKGNYDFLEISLGNGLGDNYFNLIFPDKKSIINLKSLENILPNISNIYMNDKNNSTKEEKIYKSKILEFFKF